MKWIVKQSGERESFDIKKVVRSLRRAGADEYTSKKVAKIVYEGVTDGETTQKIYKKAHELLGEYDTVSAARYGLKKALMRLGPTGYPFEKYMSKILETQGYKTQINNKLKGVCVHHEVDILAEKDGINYMVECKYHNQQGYSTGLKEALYTQARFQDLEEAGVKIQIPWMICNTKITDTAIKYGQNRGMKFTSWGYPPKENLQNMIECDCNYPITILKNVTEKIKYDLAKKNIILVQDLKKLTLKEISKLTGKPQNKLKPLQKELEKITAKK